MKLKLKASDLRPVVKVFGEDYRLPYFAAAADELIQQQAVVSEAAIIDKTYPGIKRPECEMLYLHMLLESKKGADGLKILSETNTVQIAGKEYTFDLSDIQRFSKQEYIVDGVTYRFREASALELIKIQQTVKTDVTKTILHTLFQHAEYQGEKYKLSELEDGLPRCLVYRIQEIMGTLRLEFEDVTVTGLNNILDLFLQKQRDK